MVCPITGAEYYVSLKGKSMKGVELALWQEGFDVKVNQSHHRQLLARAPALLFPIIG
jgi:hypothetical protein